MSSRDSARKRGGRGQERAGEELTQGLDDLRATLLLLSEVEEKHDVSHPRGREALPREDLERGARAHGKVLGVLDDLGCDQDGENGRCHADQVFCGRERGRGTIGGGARGGVSWERRGCPVGAASCRKGRRGPAREKWVSHRYEPRREPLDGFDAHRVGRSALFLEK